MNINEKENLIRLYIMLGEDASAYSAAIVYTQLVNCSRALTRLDVAACNGEIEDAEYEKRVEKVYARVESVLSAAPGLLYWYHQRDPRGVALRVSDKWQMTMENYDKGLAIW